MEDREIVYSIKPVLQYGSATHYPIDIDILGKLMVGLKSLNISEDEIIQKMRFFYGYQGRNQEWLNAGVHPENKEYIKGWIYMHENPSVRLIGKEGLYKLRFFGQQYFSDCHYTEVETFKELFSLVGIRKACPVRIPEKPTSDIPKRIDTSLFRF